MTKLFTDIFNMIASNDKNSDPEQQKQGEEEIKIYSHQLFQSLHSEFDTYINNTTYFNPIDYKTVDEVNDILNNVLYSYQNKGWKYRLLPHQEYNIMSINKLINESVSNLLLAADIFFYNNIKLSVVDGKLVQKTKEFWDHISLSMSYCCIAAAKLTKIHNGNTEDGQRLIESYKTLLYSYFNYYYYLKEEFMVSRRFNLLFSIDKNIFKFYGVYKTKHQGSNFFYANKKNDVYNKITHTVISTINDLKDGYDDLIQKYTKSADDLGSNSNISKDN